MFLGLAKIQSKSEEVENITSTIMSNKINDTKNCVDK